jgi:hypothetical protein
VLRILSAELGPAFQGELVRGILGVDNIRAMGESSGLIGDLDCDGDVDFDDISAFVLGLGDPAAYELQYGVPPSFKGDTDGDGDLDFDDIPAFVELLTPRDSSAAAVPEPGTWSLVLAATVTAAIVYFPRLVGRLSALRERADCLAAAVSATIRS